MTKSPELELAMTPPCEKSVKSSNRFTPCLGAPDQSMQTPTVEQFSLYLSFENALDRRFCCRLCLHFVLTRPGHHPAENNRKTHSMNYLQLIMNGASESGANAAAFWTFFRFVLELSHAAPAWQPDGFHWQGAWRRYRGGQIQVWQEGHF
jgi:hypothetical protein